MTNLGHFCDPDPERNCYPNPVKALNLQGNWEIVRDRKWPIHEMCSGKTIIDFGLETELIVKCDCMCHPPK